MSRIALVTDHAWMKTAVTLLQSFLPARMTIFPLADLDVAKAWISAP